jgi:hypothetical protein
MKGEIFSERVEGFDALADEHNAQAVTLIRLVARFPETVAQLAALS